MKFILPLLLCISLIGCAQSGAPRVVKEPRTPTPKMTKERYDDVSHGRVLILYGSKNIYKWIHIKNVRMGMAGKLAKFAVTIENNTQSALPIEYQVTWLDEYGFPLPVSTQAWIRLSLPENAEKHVMDVAKMPTGYYAEILVRGAKDIQILVPLPLKYTRSGRTEIDHQNLYNEGEPLTPREYTGPEKHNNYYYDNYDYDYDYYDDYDYDHYDRNRYLRRR